MMNSSVRTINNVKMAFLVRSSATLVSLHDVTSTVSRRYGNVFYLFGFTMYVPFDGRGYHDEMR